MKQILVASDFSNCAGNAMEYAVELARILNLQLCVIHAISSNEGVDNSIYRAIFIEDYYNNKRQALATWAAGFVSKQQYSGVQLTTLCEVGSLATVLSDYMDTHPVDLLVMGSMGSTGIAGLFGSNAGMMVSKTKTPTLVIPLETKFTANPVITLATDFESTLSPEDVTILNELVHGFKTPELNVLNILETPEWKTNEAGENKIKALIPDTKLEFKYIQEDSAKEGLLSYIKGNNTDILCLVKRHHNIVYRLFNRSTINQVMDKSVKAILVLHE